MSSPNLQKGKRVGSEWELLGGHELHSQGDIVSKLDVWICDNCWPSGVLWWLRTRATGIKFTCTWISSHFSCLLLSTTLYVIHFPGNLVNRAQTEARIVAEPFEECTEHAWFKTGPAASSHRDHEDSYFRLGPSSLVPWHFGDLWFGGKNINWNLQV